MHAFTVWLVCFILTLPCVWLFYLSWFQVIASYSEWYYYLMAGGFFSALLMFQWIVHNGEVGQLIIVVWSTRFILPPGWYYLPNMFPFARGIRMLFGAGVRIISQLYPRPAKSRVQLNVDSSVTHSSVQARTNSIFRMNLNKLSDKFFDWFFTIHGDDGEIEYYRIGRICFTAMVLVALLGCIVAPSKQNGKPPVTQVTEAESTSVQGSFKNYRKSIRVKTAFETSPAPLFPLADMFVESTDEVLQYRMIGGKKYFLFRSVPPGSISGIEVTEPLCAVVPAGRQIAFLTNLPPLSADNIKNEVSYLQKQSALPLRDKLLVLAFEDKAHKEQPYYPTSSTWERMRTNWNTVNHKQVIITQAIPLGDLEDGALGGLICF